MSFLKSAWQRLAAPEGGMPGWYASVLRQTQSVPFYTEYGISDTFDGRFDLLVLHIALVHEAVGPTSEAGDQVLECFLKDMDRALREQGVSDIGVGRRMRRVGEALYGRLMAYAAAGAEGEAWEAALSRNIWRGAPPQGGQVQRLVAYVGEARERLHGLPDLNHDVSWPAPEQIEVTPTVGDAA